MTTLSTLSTAVFEGFCNIVGSEREVQTRRMAMDIEELTTNTLCFKEPSTGEVSLHWSLNGSRRDGFCLPGSDFDVMIWTDNIVVLPENVTREQYPPAQNLKMYLKCVPSQPGFVFLKFLYACFDNDITDSDLLLADWGSLMNEYDDVRKFLCVVENNIYVLNSGIYQFLLEAQEWLTQLHGPCIMLSLAETEMDIAVSFKGNFWPPTATEWISRAYSWLHPDIIQSIVEGGCHFVPIGSKQSTISCLEWRISFSGAENVLMKSLNHCQFLTYGLLKFFLKEVINAKDDEPVVCSYFIKTVIFWKIQENALAWSPDNFLSCFWICFKQIIHWVYQNYVPNFFIPDNNMLKGKYNECYRCRLFDKLYALYEHGITCIFLSESIRNSFNQGKLINCRTDIEVLENREIRSDLHFFSRVDHFPLFPYISLTANLMTYDVANWFISHYLSREFQTNERSVIANKSLTMYLHAQIFGNVVNGQTNRVFYKSKLAPAWLQISALAGDLSMTLYIALYMYMNGSYNDALTVLSHSECMLGKPYVIYNGQVNGPNYIDLFHGKTLQNKFRNAVAMDVLISAHFLQIYLNFDLMIMQSNGWAILRIPPLVFLHMLEILCFDKIDHDKRQRALHKLYFLVHFDEGKYVPKHLRDISWGLLGICQYMCDDYRGSQNSYSKALESEDTNNIRGAMAKRLQYFADMENV